MAVKVGSCWKIVVKVDFRGFSENSEKISENFTIFCEKILHMVNRATTWRRPINFWDSVDSRKFRSCENPCRQKNLRRRCSVSVENPEKSGEGVDLFGGSISNPSS